MDFSLTKDRIEELAPRKWDWDAEFDPGNPSNALDLNWNLPDKLAKDFREFGIYQGYETDDDGIYYWSACKNCAGNGCNHLVFAEGIINSEEDLKVPLKWLETQDDSLLEWEDMLGEKESEHLTPIDIV